jgi:hypothetical protein
MTSAMTYSNAPDISTDDYLVIGLATCFVKDEGEVHEVKVAEPIPSAALEAIIKGIPTSYQLAYGTTIGAILTQERVMLPADFPPETQVSDDFADRAIAATRTYKSRPEAKAHVPLGTTRNDFHFSTERKRVLNSERIVRTEDNVKQHDYTHKVL